MKHTEVPHELDNREIYQLEHGDKIIYAVEETTDVLPKGRAACRRCQDAESVLQAKPRHSQWKFVDAVGETTD